jgi:hypothetical protein
MKLPNLSVGTNRYIMPESLSTKTEETGILNSSLHQSDRLHVFDPIPYAGPCGGWSLCCKHGICYCCVKSWFGWIPVPQ